MRAKEGGVRGVADDAGDASADIVAEVDVEEAVVCLCIHACRQGEGGKGVTFGEGLTVCLEREALLFLEFVDEDEGEEADAEGGRSDDSQ